MDRTTRLHNEMHRLSRHMCGGGVEECGRMTELLDKIEDERAHREAEKLRETAKKLRSNAPDRTGLLVAALRIDPYEMRDGQLVRKSDGKAVTL